MANEQENSSEEIINAETRNEETNNEETRNEEINNEETIRIVSGTISDDIRMQMVRLQSSGMGVTSISRQLGIKRNTVGGILRRFNKTGKIQAEKRGRPSNPILNDSEKTEILSWIDENALLTLKEICTKVQEKFNKSVSKSTVDRILKEFHYSLKMLVRAPERRNCPSKLQQRKEYADRFRELETTTRHENIVFIDEVGFKVVTRPKKGRAPVGQSAYSFVSAARSRNISVAAAMNKNGVINSKIHDRPINGEDFKAYLVELKQECIRKGVLEPVFVMDNARIHHYSGLNQVIEDENLRI